MVGWMKQVRGCLVKLARPKFVQTKYGGVSIEVPAFSQHGS